jgi:hypothetical protein
MDEHGYRQCRPRTPDASVVIEPFIDLASGYVLRAVDSLPKQGDRAPWRLYQNYARDVLLLKHGRLEDEAMEFSDAA